MKRYLVKISLTVICILGFGASQALSLTIDTNPTWDGRINDGYVASAQSLTIDVHDNFFRDIGFYFDQDSFGREFDFTLSDVAGGSGSIFFSTSFIVTSGINVIEISQALTPGSLVWANIDYRGFRGETAHISQIDGYSGGNSAFAFADTSFWEDYPDYDHRFVANFSSVTVPIPVPGTLILFASGLIGLGFLTGKIQFS